MSLPGKTNFHPRNAHQGVYDFDLLAKNLPSIDQFVKLKPNGQKTIDFGDPQAVKALNKSLVLSYYGFVNWDIPDAYLCPAVPGRAEYIHHMADVLAQSATDLKPPKGNHITILDIGTGANCIYPIIANHTYHWSAIGSDIDPKAIAWSQTLLAQNPNFCGSFCAL